MLNITEIFSAFVVMFAIIDITGSIPVFLSIQEHKHIKPLQVCLVSMGLFVGFFYAGNGILRLFSVDVGSFAVAGSIVIFVLALEMILGIEIFKNESAGSDSVIVPIAFPLIAGPGALTALLSLRAEYADANILVGLVGNILLDFLVLYFLNSIQRLLGGSVIFILRKFFGVILLAIAVKLFVTNLQVVMGG